MVALTRADARLQQGLPLGLDHVFARILVRRRERQRAVLEQLQPRLLFGPEIGRRVGQFRGDGLGFGLPCGALVLQGSPAQAPVQDLGRRRRRHPGKLAVEPVQFGGRQTALQGLADLLPGALPGAVGLGWVDGKMAKGLGPGPLRARRHRQGVELGAGQAGLHLEEALSGTAELLLPAHPSRSAAPGEELTAGQARRGGVHQSRAIGVDDGQPLAVRRRDATEEVVGIPHPRRVAVVDAVQDRDVHQLGELERRRGGRDVAATDILIDPHVGPPVHRQHPVVRVDQADPGEEELRVRRQVQIDLVGEALDPVPGVEAQGGLALAAGDQGRVEGRHRQVVVSQLCRVPLDAAIHPGIAQCQVTRLQDGVLGDELFAAGLVQDLGDQAADLGQHRDPEVLVLQHYGEQVFGLPDAVVAVLDAVWQHAEPRLPAHARPVFDRDAVRLEVDLAVEFGGTERRQRVVRSHLGGRNPIGLYSQRCHRATPEFACILGTMP